MAIRTDKVQLDIEFITDESKQFAKSILDTKALTSEIDKAKKELRDYERELQKTTLSEAKRTEILGKQADAEKRVADNLTKIAEEAKKTASIDLARLAPAQLIERAKQLEQAMKLIPTHAPAYGALVTQLKATNDRLATLRTETRGVAAAMVEAEKKGSAFSRVMGTVVGVFTGGALLEAGKVALQYIGNLFSASTAMSGMQEKTRAVFGEATTIVQGFADANAKALGLTRQEYINLSTSIGDLLVPMGFTQETAAKLSTELVNQGGVLSEWSKGKVTGAEATEILQKALLGERDALNTLGIDIKQSMVDDELKRRGLDDLTGKSLRQAEALVTLDLITQQSTAGNAAFAEQTESLSRKKGELVAKITEVAQRLAAWLIPVFGRVIDVAGPLIDAVVSVTSKIGALAEKIGVFKVAGVVFDTVVATIKTAIEGIGMLADGIGLLASGEFSKAVETMNAGAKKLLVDTVLEGGKVVVSAISGGAKAAEPEAKKSGKKLARAFADGYEAEFEKIKNDPNKTVEALTETEKKALEKAAEIDKLKADIIKNRRLGNAVGIGSRARPDNVSSQIGAAGGANADRLAEEATLREKFRSLLNMEEEFEVEMSAIQVAKADDRLRMLRDNGLTETQEYQKALDAKLKAQENHAQAVEDLERRTHEYKKFTLKEGLSMSSDALDVAIDLLSKDEQARKKNAAAIRAFQIAQVITNGVLEVQKIWASVAEFGPLAPIVGGVLTAFAVGRSVASIQRIRSQKFARGGTVGFFGGNSHSAGGTQGYFSDGTQIEVEKDEAFAIVNKRNAPMLRLLSAVNSYGSNGVPYDRPGGSYFAQGGIPRLNTTPNGGKQQSAPVIPSIEMFVAAVDRFERIVAGFPREVRASVNYFDVKKAGETIREIQNEAGV